MTIKNLVKLFEQIGEKILPEMIGGEFFQEEKVFLIENAYIQNKWLAGKAYLKENHSIEMTNSKKRVRSIKAAHSDQEDESWNVSCS